MAETGILSSGAHRSQNRRRAIEVVSAARASQTTTSATFAAVTNASNAVVWPGGNALVIVSVSHYVATAGGCKPQYKLTDGSSDLTSTFHAFINGTNEHEFATWAEIVSLPRGAYTVQLEWANSNTTGTLTSNADDWMSVEIIPVF